MRNRVKNISKKITYGVGSPTSIILHTIFFIGIFALNMFGVSFENILLILTTIVSLEAIYLSIFIQMTVNKHGADLEEVSEDIEEIQENVEEIQEDVGELQEDVEEITEEEEVLDNHSVEMKKLEHIENALQTLLQEINSLKK